MSEPREIELLRRGFAARAAAPPEDGCPEPEELWAAVTGELPPQRTRRIVDHLAGCAACAEDWRLAREIARGAGRAAGRPAARSPTTTGRLWYLAAAAAIVLVAGALVWRTARPPEPAAAYRALAETTIRSLTPEEIPLPREQLLLRWTSEAEPATFTLRVATEELDTLTRVEGLESPEFRVTPAVVEGLAAGDRILWQVEALFPDGRKTVSETFVNRLE